MAKIEIYNPKATEKRILDNRMLGLFVAATWEKYFAKYVPFQEGILVSNTSTEPFKVIYESPYAHYIWNGILFVSPTTGSSWSEENEPKIPTDIPLNYSKEQNPLATSHWEIPAYEAFEETVSRQITEYLKRL